MIKIGQILDELDKKKYKYEFCGNKNERIDGFSSLGNYRTGSLTWVRDAEILSKIECDKILCAIVQKGVSLYADNQIIVENSKEIFFYILKTFWGRERTIPGIGNGTYISEKVVVGKNVSIGHNCTLDGDIHIGEGTVIENNVVIINNVNIGSNCIIHSGAVIGTDGFGYSFDKDKKPIKVEHFGGVILHDRVEVGANACIDRGTIDNTVIGSDTKIDNLVHIAHNCQVGEDVLFVAGAVICGSAVIKDYSYIAPGGIVKDQVQVGQNCFVGMGAFANTDLEANTILYERSTKKLINKDYHGLI